VNYGGMDQVTNNSFSLQICRSTSSNVTWALCVIREAPYGVPYYNKESRGHPLQIRYARTSLNTIEDKMLTPTDCKLKIINKLVL